MLPLYSPFALTIAAPANMGKTEWVKKFLKYQSQLLDKPYQKVIWYYKIWQETYETIDAEFRQGAPTTFEDRDCIIVYDDKFTNMQHDLELAESFCVRMHHQNLGLIFVTQLFFANPPIIRTCSRNSSYIVLLKNTRSAGVAQTLGMQLWPNRPKWLLDAYDKSTKDKQWAYIFIDLHSRTPDKFRLRTNIFPDEQPMRVFI